MPLLFFILTSAMPAGAAILMYSLSGTGSGSLNQTAFVDAPFEITVFAETQSATPAVQQGFWTYTVPASEARVQVSGSSGRFLVPTRFFVSQLIGSAGFSIHDGSFFGGPDLMNIQNPSLSTWDLRSPIGPVFLASASIPVQGPPTRPVFTNISTELGLLSFTAASNVTFRAAAVPEPGTMALGSTSLAILALRSRRRLRGPHGDAPYLSSSVVVVRVRRKKARAESGARIT